MNIKKKIDNNKLFIKLAGELDEYTSNYTRTVIDELINTEKFDQLIFDLSELDFMDSTGIGVMLGRYKKLNNMHIPIYIQNPNKNIEKLFKISGIFEIMPKIV